MPSFTFEGFDTGTPVDLSVTQGGNTVSDAVGTWGQQPVGTATIGIAQTKTVATQFDSVQFTPTGWADFDTPETHAPSGNVYKPQWHDILYFWDTGKTGNWSAPINTLPAHKSRQHALGPVINVVFDTPGVKTVSLYAYEPSSGKFAVASVNVTVTAADSAFATTQTVCVNRFGDTDFSAKPAGALEYNLPADNTFDAAEPAWSANINSGTNIRYLFKGGSQYTMALSGVSAGDIPAEIMFGSYGTGRAEFINGTGTVMHLGDGYGSVRTIMLNNLIFTGDHNASNETGGPDRVIGTGSNARLIVHNVEVHGYAGVVFNLQGDLAAYNYHHFDDLALTNMGGQYPILNNAFTHPNSAFAMTGCRVARDPQSDFDEGFSGLGGDQRAPVRHNQSAYAYFQGNDFFQNTGDQPALKLAQFGVGGGLQNVHCNSFETSGSVGIQHQKGDAGVIDNFICRQNVFTSTCAEGGTQYSVTTGAHGTSFDGNLAIGPGTTGAIAAQYRAAIRFNANGSAANAPCTFRNNTVVNLKGATENINSNFGDYANLGMSVTAGCNLVYAPNMSVTAHAPLEDGPAGVSLWTPRNTGRYSSGAFNTAYATDPATVYSFRPEAGSSALGARTNEAVYPLPIDGQTAGDIRPVSADFGCWQGAV